VPTGPGLKSADDIVTVRHYTSTEYKKLIEQSGILKGGKTWVTLPDQIPSGLGKGRIGQSIVEKRLGIEAGKGEWFIDIQVKRSALREVPGYPRTSGGALQWILGEDAPIANSRFLPWFAW